MIFKGIQTSIAKKPTGFVIFKGDSDPLSPLLDPHIRQNKYNVLYNLCNEFSPVTLKLGLNVRKFPTRSDSKQSAQLQRKARLLKLLVQLV